MTERPAIRFQTGHPSFWLSVRANRAGFLLLRDVFAKAADAPPGRVVPGSPEALALVDGLEESVVPGSPYCLMEVAVDESLTHDVPPGAGRRLSKLSDATSLIGCVGALMGTGAAVLVFIRGLFALWKDLQ